MAQNKTDQTLASGKNAGGGKRRIFWLGVVLVFIIVVAIFSVAYRTAQKAEKELTTSIQADMGAITFNRLSEVNKWLESIVEQTSRFANSKIITDFARDVDELGGDLGAAINSGDEEDGYSSVSDITLLQSYLANFIAYSNFDFGCMLNSRGEMYINTDPAYQTLSSRQRSVVAEVVKSGRVTLGPISVTGERPLQLEIYVPVSSTSPDGSRVVAVLYMNQSVSPKLRELLNIEGYTGQGYSIALLQRVGSKLEQVDLKNGRVREIPSMDISASGEILLGERDSVSGLKRVYSQGVAVEHMGAWIVVELDAAQARMSLDQRVNDYYKLAALGALVLVLLVSVIWRWFISLERAQTLSRFKELFSVIDDQKRLLDSINGTIAEPICLNDTKGKFLYVNQAFAEAFGRDAESIVGLDTAAVYGFDTSRRLNSSDQHVLMSGEKVNTSEIIWLQSKRHYFQISKAPLRDSDSQSIVGIVSVFRDVTKLVETEERSHRVVQQTIDALVMTIEQSDPFLGGHSRIMGEVAKLISKGMNLPDKVTSTIEIAATLSQVGKVFVPREVLTKPGALTAEEKKVMEQHVEHALQALGKIEFDLPVLEAISQMNERLDGKGYPAGLKGDDISIYGKVLAVANAFTAMARPRAYRPAMSLETVLDTLQKQSGSSYDPQVLEVLKNVLNTPAGERIMSEAAKSTPV